MLVEELKKQTRSIDLAVQAGRKRQSARTGLIHDGEVIPIYENFCFVLALFRQKTGESIIEGKALLERLLALNCFPVFFHDYPRCYDFQMPLKVAPLLLSLLRLFGNVLGDLKSQIEEALKQALANRPDKSAWENRYRACVGEPLLPVETADFSAAEWREWIITAQLAGQTHFAIPYNPDLQLFMGPSRFDIQEKGEPRPSPIEWLLAEGDFSSRLLRDHPDQLLCAPLFPITYTTEEPRETSLRKLWKGSTIHSLVGKGLVFDLPAGVELGRSDLFEVALFTDVSPETTLFIEGRKATSFQLGDRVTIQTPSLSIDLCFELTKGSGDFYGHIFRANRPSQCEKGYEAYDWQIGVRTLRRSSEAQITVMLSERPV